MDGLINDILTMIIIPWLILIERRTSRMEGALNIIIKTLNGKSNKKGDCRMVG